MSNPYLYQNRNTGYQGYNPNQFQPAAFPYQQPQQQMIQRPIPTQFNGISGRIINSIEEVTANEVPMDGTTGVFPACDYSCIYTKAWNSDGTIKTIKYIPVFEEPKQETSTPESISDMISKRFDRLEQMLAQPRKENSDE